MERHSGIFCIVSPFNLVYSQNLSKNTFYLYLSSILISKMPHHSGNLSEVQKRPGYSSHQIIFYFYPLQLFQQWLCSNPQKNKCRTGMTSSNRLWEYPTGNERWHGELTSLTGDVARNEEEWIHVLACAFVVAHFSKTVTASGSSESTGRRRSDRT